MSFARPLIARHHLERRDRCERRQLAIFLNNAGVTEINRSLQRTELAGLVEGGAFARYFITNRLTARVGYEFWWIHGVALAPRQIGAVISQNTGRHLEGTTEIIFYGASGGIEYVW